MNHQKQYLIDSASELWPFHLRIEHSSQLLILADLKYKPLEAITHIDSHLLILREVLATKNFAPELNFRMLLRL